jgi:hypothetical protein
VLSVLVLLLLLLVLHTPMANAMQQSHVCHSAAAGW